MWPALQSHSNCSLSGLARNTPNGWTLPHRPCSVCNKSKLKAQAALASVEQVPARKIALQVELADSQLRNGHVADQQHAAAHSSQHLLLLPSPQQHTADSVVHVSLALHRHCQKQEQQLQHDSTGQQQEEQYCLTQGDVASPAAGLADSPLVAVAALPSLLSGNSHATEQSAATAALESVAAVGNISEQLQSMQDAPCGVCVAHRARISRLTLRYCSSLQHQGNGAQADTLLWSIVMRMTTIDELQSAVQRLSNGNLLRPGVVVALLVQMGKIVSQQQRQQQLLKQRQQWEQHAKQAAEANRLKLLRRQHRKAAAVQQLQDQQQLDQQQQEQQQQHGQSKQQQSGWLLLQQQQHHHHQQQHLQQLQRFTSMQQPNQPQLFQRPKSQQRHQQQLEQATLTYAGNMAANNSASMSVLQKPSQQLVQQLNVPYTPDSSQGQDADQPSIAVPATAAMSAADPKSTHPTPQVSSSWVVPSHQQYLLQQLLGLVKADVAAYKRLHPAALGLLPYWLLKLQVHDQELLRQLQAAARRKLSYAQPCALVPMLWGVAKYCSCGRNSKCSNGKCSSSKDQRSRGAGGVYGSASRSASLQRMRQQQLSLQQQHAPQQQQGQQCVLAGLHITTMEQSQVSADRQQHHQQVQQLANPHEQQLQHENLQCQQQGQQQQQHQQRYQEAHYQQQQVMVDRQQQQQRQQTSRQKSRSHSSQTYKQQQQRRQHPSNISPDPAFISIWLEASAPNLSSFSSSELASSIYSLALLDRQPPQHWLHSFFAASEGLLQRSSAQDLSNMLWALGRLRLRPSSEAWWNKYQAAVLAVLRDFTGIGTTNLIWGAARLELQPSAHVAELLLWQAQRTFWSMDLQLLVSLAWGVAKLGLKPRKIWLHQLCKRVTRQYSSLTPGLASSLLLSLGALHHCPRMWMGRFLRSLQPQLSAFSPQDMANTFTAFARMLYTPNQDWLFEFTIAARGVLSGCGPQQLLPIAHALAVLHSNTGYRVNPDFLAALLGRARTTAAEFGVLDCVNLAHSLVYLKVAPGVGLLSALVTVFMQQMQSATDSEVCGMLWALGAFWRSGDECIWLRQNWQLVQQLVAVAGTQLHRYQPLQLKRVIVAVAAMGCKPDSTWLAAHEAAVSRQLEQMYPATLEQIMRGYRELGYAPVNKQSLLEAVARPKQQGQPEQQQQSQH